MGKEVKSGNSEANLWSLASQGIELLGKTAKTVGAGVANGMKVASAKLADATQELPKADNFVKPGELPPLAPGAQPKLEIREDSWRTDPALSAQVERERNKGGVDERTPAVDRASQGSSLFARAKTAITDTAQDALGRAGVLYNRLGGEAKKNANYYADQYHKLAAEAKTSDELRAYLTQAAPFIEKIEDSDVQRWFRDDHILLEARLPAMVAAEEKAARYAKLSPEARGAFRGREGLKRTLAEGPKFISGAAWSSSSEEHGVSKEAGAFVGGFVNPNVDYQDMKNDVKDFYKNPTALGATMLFLGGVTFIPVLGDLTARPLRAGLRWSFHAENNLVRATVDRSAESTDELVRHVLERGDDPHRVVGRQNILEHGYGNRGEDLGHRINTEEDDIGDLVDEFLGDFDGQRPPRFDFPAPRQADEVLSTHPDANMSSIDDAVTSLAADVSFDHHMRYQGRDYIKNTVLADIDPDSPVYGDLYDRLVAHERYCVESGSIGEPMPIPLWNDIETAKQNYPSELALRRASEGLEEPPLIRFDDQDENVFAQMAEEARVEVPTNPAGRHSREDYNAHTAGRADDIVDRTEIDPARVRRYRPGDETVIINASRGPEVTDLPSGAAASTTPPTGSDQWVNRGEELRGVAVDLTRDGDGNLYYPDGSLFARADELPPVADSGSVGAGRGHSEAGDLDDIELPDDLDAELGDLDDADIDLSGVTPNSSSGAASPNQTAPRGNAASAAAAGEVGHTELGLRVQRQQGPQRPEQRVVVNSPGAQSGAASRGNDGGRTSVNEAPGTTVNTDPNYQPGVDPNPTIVMKFTFDEQGNMYSPDGQLFLSAEQRAQFNPAKPQPKPMTIKEMLEKQAEHDRIFNGNGRRAYGPESSHTDSDYIDSAGNPAAKPDNPPPPPPPSMPKVKAKITGPDGVSMEADFDKPIFIGRRVADERVDLPFQTLQVNDKHLSGQQAAIGFNGDGKVVLYNLSKQGTTVNGRLIEGDREIVVLQKGKNVIEAGNTKIVLMVP